jgi:hypothetical protein
MSHVEQEKSEGSLSSSSCIEYDLRNYENLDYRQVWKIKMLMF